MKIKNYLQSLRAPFAAASIFPVIFTAAWLLYQGYKIDPKMFFLILAGVVLIHLMSNVINDYFDWDKSDKINKNVNDFSGGSRQKLAKGFNKKTLLFIFAALLILCLLITYLLFLKSRILLILFGIIGLLLGLSYSSPPFNLQARGLGEIIIFILFGPFLTFSVVYAFSGTLTVESFIIGIPNGLLTTMIILINEFPDYDADMKSGKKNILVRIGLHHGKLLYYFLIVLYYLSVMCGVVLKILPLYSMAVLITLPIIFQMHFELNRNYKNPKKIVSVQIKTILFQIFNNIVLISSIPISKLIT